ncbi:hypothetical protein CRM22_005255 [Opisthorchis felineus]|uniref:Uncharacterized protein n=1 Tax=Opisthorchis felineus TaxID=147828 RepID=A0A4S2LS23_OPIFE|nr:hypothetical protein CRM22_005255 [Opisthorchis felineus]
MVKKVSILESFAPVDGESAEGLQVADKKQDSPRIVAHSSSAEQYLENLWGADAVNYFFNPTFIPTGKTSSAEENSTKIAPFDQLTIGGYPNGLLHGSRVPFHPELNPWLLQPIEPELLRRRKSECARRPSLALLTSERRMSALRPVGVSGLIETLRLHAGVNPGATNVWEVLRSRSYKLLQNLEKANEKSNETFAVFTREYVLSGREKPPLCDFIRTNTSGHLAQTMRHLKAHGAEKQFRKTKAMVAWAERNQEHLQIILQQHDIRDKLEREKVKNRVEHYGGDAKKRDSKTVVVTPAERPEVFQQTGGPGIELASKPLVDDFLPENWNDTSIQGANHVTENRRVSKLNSVRTGAKAEEKCMCVGKLSQKLQYMKGSKTLSGGKNNFTKWQELPMSPASGVLARTHSKEIQALSAFPDDTTVEPLCWSQLIEQQTQMRQRNVCDKN